MIQILIIARQQGNIRKHIGSRRNKKYIHFKKVLMMLYIKLIYVIPIRQKIHLIRTEYHSASTFQIVLQYSQSEQNSIIDSNTFIQVVGAFK